MFAGSAPAVSLTTDKLPPLNQLLGLAPRSVFRSYAFSANGIEEGNACGEYASFSVGSGTYTLTASSLSLNRRGPQLLTSHAIGRTRASSFCDRAGQLRTLDSGNGQLLPPRVVAFVPSCFRICQPFFAVNLLVIAYTVLNGSTRNWAIQSAIFLVLECSYHDTFLPLSCSPDSGRVGPGGVLFDNCYWLMVPD